MDPTDAPSILSVARALPRHYADQETLIAALRRLWAKKHFNVSRLEELHRAVGVGGRYLALPIDEYQRITSFTDANKAWQRVALELGTTAVRTALLEAKLKPREIGHVFFNTVTGLATPSIDARMVNRLELARDVKRTPIFGLGCVGGAAALARATDWLRAYPDGVAVVLAVELCSLTLQRDDLSIANIIASGLFGDGAAAVVLAGARRARALEEGGSDGHPRVVSTRAAFYPGTEDVMGWDFIDSGFKVVLSPRVPEVIRDHIAADVDGFLGDAGLTRGEVQHWIAHTGGPKVLESFEKALGLPRAALERSWHSLATVGNLSSASVLFVLEDMLDAGVARAGDRGLLVAMGPGFCAEMALLAW